MLSISKTSLYTFLCVMLLMPAALTKAQRAIMSFDKDWHFLKQDAPGAEQPSFDDKAWRTLDVPHDWSIEGPYDRNNTTSRGGGYLPAGIGWYRKQFTLTQEQAKQKVFIEFDGVMSNSDVWINGHHLGKRPYGYISFSYELTPYLMYGNDKPNILAVRADNSLQPASRWYAGAGIYRHVRLVMENPVHVAQWGIFITTPAVTAKQATVQVQTTLSNQSAAKQTITLQTTLLTPDGKIAGTATTQQSISAGANNIATQTIVVSNPALWNLDRPQLCVATTKIVSGKQVADEVSTPFGIRQIRFDAATGFYLNEKNVKIKGVCMHHDAGAVGAAVPSSIWRRRLELLKSVGVNAIRTSHNPPSPEFLDLCDQMGILVMDESFDAWESAKNTADDGYNLYFKDWWDKDTRDIILRDRNHPAIIMYSVGNEIRDNLNNPAGFKKFTNQRDQIKNFDTTRPVTMALFRPGESKVYESGFAELMDLVGQNYRENELVAVHNKKPFFKTIGTENGHTRQAWLAMRDNPFIAGQFLWTGFDYLGEAEWPNIGNQFGLFDRTGGVRPRTFERASWWSDQPVLHIVRSAANAGTGTWVSDWTPDDFDTYDEAHVEVYSNCDEVELLLNGKSLGTKTLPADDAARAWQFAFQKGTLEAIGKNKGRVVATDKLVTAGKPSKILLTTGSRQLHNSWDDVATINVAITDDIGVIFPTADDLVTFKVEGPGKIIAVDNANPASYEPYQAVERHAWKGRCIALVRATGSSGKITVTATSANLKEGTVVIEAN